MENISNLPSATSGMESIRQIEETVASYIAMKGYEEAATLYDGSFAEAYFFYCFKNGKKNFFGKEFDDIALHLKNYWQGVEDEYDIVLYNHVSVAIIEVKYKAHLKDIPAVLKKAETFRILFPQYKDFKIYLGLATMSFYSELEQECIEQGIAVIKQVGDKVVINDSNLKVF